MGKDVKVSVISPTFNRAVQLRRGISSLIRQPTKTPYEIIIVDDGSVDDTRNVVRALIEVGAQSGIEIKYIYLDHPSPRISCYPKNVGIREAVGDVLVFCEPEILHVSDTLGQLMAKLEESNVYIPVATQVWSMGELIYKSFPEATFMEPQTILSHKFAYLASGSETRNPRATSPAWAITGHKRTFGSWCFACLKEDIFAIGGWDEELAGYGFDDFDLFHRFMMYGRQLVWCEDIIVIHQWHERAYPFDIHKAANANRLKSMARQREGEFRANIGKEWGKI